MYFLSDGNITRSNRDLLPGGRSRYSDAPTALDLFEQLNRDVGKRSFVFAHVGGRYADMQMHNEELEVAVEIHSAWGTFEWLLDDALKRGYRVGICANSDDHKGRPGASYPGAGLFGCYEAKEYVLGGLDKKIIIYALPDEKFEVKCELALEMELDKHPMMNGWNPVFLHIRQVDGHRAWTSPIYLNFSKGDGNE